VLTIAPLARHQELVPLLAQWFIAEWPEWYGDSGRGSAAEDLAAFAASESCLPVGLVAFNENTPIGVAALKPESLPSHRHLKPWAAAGLVLQLHRGKGVGARLLQALAHQAFKLGYDRIYCATATSASLLNRSGWQQLEVIQHEGESLVIFAKETEALYLDPQSADCPLSRSPGKNP
jgi:GNAT superfamily N-acetyltransferase